MPRKNKESSTASNIISGITGGKDSDASSVSSVSTMGTTSNENGRKSLSIRGQFMNLLFYFWISKG